MHRVIITTSSHNVSRLENQLFELGASSVSVEKTGNTLRICALSDNPGRITSAIPGMECTVETLPEDWKYRWMDGRGPVPLTDSIVVLPEGNTLPGEMTGRYEHVIKLDPRDAFGDGHHPTTRLCAKLLEEYLHSGHPEIPDNPRVLDMGTGTGILALAASCLGIRHIDAVDNDPDSIQRAENNIRLNGAPAGIVLHLCDAATFSPGRHYHIVMANLLSGILEENIDHLEELADSDGILILSGVSSRWDRRMQNFFNDKNLLIDRNLEESGWCAYLLRFRQP